MKIQTGAPLLLEREPSGWRHYLAGQAVRLGTMLELQAVQLVDDDDGGHLEPVEGNWVDVRYEADLRPGDAENVRIWLHSELGGHAVRFPGHEGMRFRWPLADG